MPGNPLRRHAGLLALILTMGSVGRAQSARPLPDRLTDAEFRSLMTGLSDQGGFSIYEDFTSNSRFVDQMHETFQLHGVNGGAYVGVGQEENFTFIAAIQPRIAFLLGIRRQAVVQHLMYKALFELSADRAEFLSLLFALPRPAGVAATTDIDVLWTRYWPVRPDSALAAGTVTRVLDRLTRVHGIALDSTDVALLRYLHASFVLLGPAIDFDGRAMRLTHGKTVLTSPTSMSITMSVRDATSGAPVPDARVSYSLRGYGTNVTTSETGTVSLWPKQIGMPVTVRVSRAGYDTVALLDFVYDRAHATHTVSLRRNPWCVLATLSAPTCRLSITSAGRGGGFGAAPPPPPPPPPAPTPAQPGCDRLGPPPVVGAAFCSSFATLTINAASFLATEARFRTIKGLHDRNLIVPVVADPGGPTALRSIGAFLRERGVPVSALYTAHAEARQENPPTGELMRFYANMATLPTTSQSMLIRQGGSLCLIESTAAAVKAGLIGPPPSVREFERSKQYCGI